MGYVYIHSFSNKFIYAISHAPTDVLEDNHKWLHTFYIHYPGEILSIVLRSKTEFPVVRDLNSRSIITPPTH